VGVKQSKLVMAKNILCKFASTFEVGNGRGLVKLLDVDRRSISKAQGRRLLVLGKMHSTCIIGTILIQLPS
jgi:hypothetical protein